MEHQPVLAGPVVDYLAAALEDGGVFVDATLGRGGHARAVLDAAPQARLVGIDRDPVALEESRTNLAPFEDRIRVVRDDFKNLATVLERLGVEEVRGVLLDLGVSSPQLDEASRGFSYRDDGPLDMRMDPDQPLTAARVVNEYPVRDLERAIRSHSDERFARRIAQAIAAHRPFRSTTELAEVVRAAIPAAARRSGPHPARRTFQAIRIEVNGELEALERVLPEATRALEAGGRFAVISYHSHEDRAVKRHFAAEARGCVCPPDFPVCTCGAEAALKVLTRRAIRPGADEIASNPRARAAKLRVAQRTSSPRLAA